MSDFEVWQHGDVWRWRIDAQTRGEAESRQAAEQEARDVLRVVNAPTIHVPSVPDLSKMSTGHIFAALRRPRRRLS